MQARFSLLLLPATGTRIHIIYIAVIDVRCVCGMCILTCCLVLFSPAAASLAPAEQLVLTTIRQETSELPDPSEGTGATMRAHLTDRFDKSESTRIRLDDAPCVSRVPKCMWPCHAQTLVATVSQPRALKSYNV